jgi:hypothetical protein
MLLLQQVQQVGGRTNAQQSLDRVEDEVDSPLRRHCEGSSVTAKKLNVTRNRPDLSVRSRTGLSVRSRVVPLRRL